MVVRSQETSVERDERTPRARRRFTLDPRGQSLVEFAISFPVVMLMLLFGVDFGRVFVGWLSLTNAVREAANFAAINPAGWDGLGDDSDAQAEYVRLISAEAGGTACQLPASLPSPTFPNGAGVGSPALVAVTCRFSLITPLMTNLLGGGVDVSAAASFPIRSGLLGGAGFSTSLPTLNPSASVTAAPSASTSANPSASASVSPSIAPTPVPLCVVPNLVDVNTSQATKKWTDAGFTANNLSFNPLVPPNYKIKSQNQSAGASIVCTSSMTVKPA